MGGPTLRLLSRAPRWSWLMRCGTRSDFTIQLIERVADLIEDLVTAWCQTVHARAFRALGLRRAEPAALRHTR
jgi:hypothetical protein